MNLPEAYKALLLAVEQFVATAMLDDKTPLGNVLALTEKASVVGTGEGNPDVVVCGDLNRFKSLNDQFGHAAGDVAITTVGELLHSLLKVCGGTAYRRGGDDFVILLQKSQLEEFKSKLSEFEACTFTFEGAIRKTAMSFGYAVYEGEADYADLLARAETACLSAKSQGDGKCVEWSLEVERKAMIHLRNRCASCGADIRVNVPKESAPADSQLMSCPCCQQTLIASQPET